MKYKYSESTEAPTHPDFLFQASVHKNPLVVNTYSKGNTLLIQNKVKFNPQINTFIGYSKTSPTYYTPKCIKYQAYIS